MEHRIRESFDSPEGLLGASGGVVEVDEAYLGGKEKNKHWDKNLCAGRGAAGKTPVTGLRDRISGKVVAKRLTSVDELSAASVLAEHVGPDAMIHTDESPVYRGLANHRTVNHSRHE